MTIGLTGEELFTLYDTFGFPVELSTEEAYKQGIKLSDNWREEFAKKMDEQRQRSKTARKGQFSGGLEGHDSIHLKYHTATHLLGAALRKVLNAPDLQQHGSNITADRLRFDFNHDKLTPEEKQAVEDQVNAWIDEDLPVSFAVYPTDEALSMGAIGAFGERTVMRLRSIPLARMATLLALKFAAVRTSSILEFWLKVASDSKSPKKNLVRLESSNQGCFKIDN